MEQEILQKLHTKLLRMLPGRDLAPVFYERKLLTQAEYDELSTIPLPNEKNRHILSCLGRRPDGMLTDLISCLEDNKRIPGVKEILQHLKEALQGSYNIGLSILYSRPLYTRIHVLGPIVQQARDVTDVNYPWF